ncbi:hypothetical protein [Nonomuraea endophytica]|uniref:hypothetical protein n=1 Tax=Nonomuraea endophytica TaxID=714136 RepID=UPI0037C75256
MSGTGAGAMARHPGAVVAGVGPVPCPRRHGMGTGPGWVPGFGRAGPGCVVGRTPA